MRYNVREYDRKPAKEPTIIPGQQYADLPTVAALIGCGLSVARGVAVRAGAQIRISDKRFTYSLPALYAYLETERVRQIEEGQTAPEDEEDEAIAE